MAALATGANPKLKHPAANARLAYLVRTKMRPNRTCLATATALAPKSRASRAPELPSHARAAKT
eukprot:5043994-Lingulodinium_polyedra.AAC.1